MKEPIATISTFLGSVKVDRHCSPKTIVATFQIQKPKKTIKVNVIRKF